MSHPINAGGNTRELNRGSGTIRPARLEEAPALSALAQRSKAHWGYDDAFLAACIEELTIAEEAIQRHPTYVVEQGGRVIGFYMLESLDAQESELTFLFIEPAAIGQGHGRKLMAHAKETAAVQGYRSLLIQGDPHAEGFYRAMGGQRIGRQPSASIPGRWLPLFRMEVGRIT